VHQYIHCDAGALIALSAEQAEFLRHGGFVEPVAPVAEAPAVATDVESQRAADTQADDVDQPRRKGSRP
jgi:hypothetical protein